MEILQSKGGEECWIGTVMHGIVTSRAYALEIWSSCDNADGLYDSDTRIYACDEENMSWWLLRVFVRNRNAVWNGKAQLNWPGRSAG